MRLKNLLVPSILLAFLLSLTFVATEKFTKAPASSPSPQIEQLKYIDVPITIDYQQEGKNAESKLVTVKEGITAWEAFKKGIGEQNVEYKDYGGDLGIFIIGINSVKPSGNKFWLFKVNGQSASVGVSSYKIQNGDKLEFVIAEPEPGQ